MAEYQTYEHDVLVIGAGGAGLRAAIEASKTGVSVGLVCKSLLGKAHTVMAEGGKFPVRQKTYNCVSCLNRNHMVWAWCSLFVVGFSDIYVRLCSMGVWHDWRIF